MQFIKGTTKNILFIRKLIKTKFIKGIIKNIFIINLFFKKIIILKEL